MFYRMKQISFIILLLVAQYSTVSAQSNEQPKVALTWVGGATMLIEFNGFKVLTDPALGSGKEAFSMGDPNEMFDLKKGPNTKFFERITKYTDVNLKTIDLVLLSHAHEDHFDQKAQSQLNPELPILLPTADVGKIKEMGFKNIDAINWGETRVFKTGAGQMKVTAINAHHSEKPPIDKILGVGNGYWFEFSQGDWRKTIYWTGDTFPTSDVVAAVKKLGKPDILIPNMGGVGTTGPLGKISMNAKDVMKLSSEVLPKKILPIHHSTYPLYLEPISNFVAEMQSQKIPLDLISEGSTLIYK